MTVSRLGYIGFKASDLDAWSTFCIDLLGLMPAPEAEGALRYRADAQSWRIAVESGPEDDIAYLGFEVPGAGDLRAFANKLQESGVLLTDVNPDLLVERGVTSLISCFDPQGLRIEIYYGPTEVHERPFASPAGVSGFVTGDGGIGHVVLGATDIAACRAFYQDLLGFRLSDTIRMRTPGGPLDLEFFHCNPRHHTLALVPAPTPKRLLHFMLQVNTLDEVGFAQERMEAAGVPITATLGRHTNDLMVSFYARTPAGFEVEYGFGARTVDEATWRVVRHDRTSCWGHKRPAGH
jgi:2,3-dihydroxybiphenyl 1,2-dioxygenase